MFSYRQYTEKRKYMSFLWGQTNCLLYICTGVCINRVSLERGSTGLSTDKRQNKKNCHQTK